MESINVTNFLTIKEAKLEIRQFTLLIGPQASGKSIIAKLLYFFRQSLSQQYVQSIASLDDKKKLQEKIVAVFMDFFPKYTWQDQEFLIAYKMQDVVFNVENKKDAKGKISLCVNYSESLDVVFRKAKREFKKFVGKSEGELDEGAFPAYEELPKILETHVYNSNVGYCFQRSVFIPASRSFFSSLQKNVFSFLANNITIDPLIKEFGSLYESSKSSFRVRSLKRDSVLEHLSQKINQELKKILIGEYRYTQGQDWIMSDKGRVNITNASSGQQESLPMLIVLARRALQYNSRVRPALFLIEEPEAHLFPNSQKNLVELFSLLHKERGHQFFLTTHSPYVLTAINNLVMASNLIASKGEEFRKEIEKVVGTHALIQFSEIRAYTFNNGVIESIINEENKLIGSSVIDGVSDDFEKVFDNLMEIEVR